MTAATIKLPPGLHYDPTTGKLSGVAIRRTRRSRKQERIAKAMNDKKEWQSTLQAVESETRQRAGGSL